MFICNINACSMHAIVDYLWDLKTHLKIDFKKLTSICSPAFQRKSCPLYLLPFDLTWRGKIA